MQRSCTVQTFDLRPLIVLLAVLALISGGIVAVALNEHATERHTDKALAGSACFDSQGSMLHMVNPDTHRNADVCFDKIFYVYITTESGDPVTMFAKDKMSRIEQVIQYLHNAGYQ